MRQKNANLKLKNTNFLIVGMVVVIVMTSGCEMPKSPFAMQGQSKPEKPSVPLSPGGITPIGVKSHADPQIGNRSVFKFNLDVGRTYEFFMNYVDNAGYTGTYAAVDDDMFIVDSKGTIIGTSTQSAGLSEHIHFTPRESGVYSILIMNDKKESGGMWPVMIVSALDYEWGGTLYIEGKDINTQGAKYETYNSLWIPSRTFSGYRSAQARINVPETLDMYQVRVFCVSGDWNNYLYSSYDLQSVNAPAGVPYASFETMGTDAVVNLDVTKDCFLGLIGEWGYGNVNVELVLGK